MTNLSLPFLEEDGEIEREGGGMEALRRLPGRLRALLLPSDDLGCQEAPAEMVEMSTTTREAQDALLDRARQRQMERALVSQLSGDLLGLLGDCVSAEEMRLLADFSL